MPRFGQDADQEAFPCVMVEAHGRHPIRILIYRVLSNHGHFVVWPQADGEVTDFFAGGRTTMRYGGGWHTVAWAAGLSFRGDSRASRCRATTIS